MFALILGNDTNYLLQMIGEIPDHHFMPSFESLAQTCQRTQYLTAFDYLPETGNRKQENGGRKRAKLEKSLQTTNHTPLPEKTGLAVTNCLLRFIGEGD